MERKTRQILLLRLIAAFLCLIMLLFMAVQYNDPDGLWWMFVYGVPAVWAGLAAWRPGLLRQPLTSVALLVSILAAVVGCFVYWPTMDAWWQKDVWWVVETAREGIGMMIVVAVLLWVAATARAVTPPTVPNP